MNFQILGSSNWSRLVLCLLALFILIPTITQANTTRSTVSSVRPEMLFEQNQGQFESSLDFVARSSGYTIGLSSSPVIELYRYGRKGPGISSFNDEQVATDMQLLESARFHLRVLGANESVQAVPLEKQAALTHYISAEAIHSHSDIPNFKRIRYPEILENIDIEYYGKDGLLEYDFVIHPGGDPTNIGLRIDGAGELSIDEAGNLVVSLGDQTIVQRAPFSYQIGTNGRRQTISSGYFLEDGIVRFTLGAWDREKTLIIDPVLEYSSYFGGSGADFAVSVDVDAAGNIYVVGKTTSSGMSSAGAFEEAISPGREEVASNPTCADCTDTGEGDIQIERVKIQSKQVLLITKLSPDAKSVIWSTYFNVPYPYWNLGLNSVAASDSGEVAFGISDAKGGLPLVNQTQDYDENQSAAYVAKLNTSGSALVFSTYLQLGSNWTFTWLRGLDVSPTGQVAVSGMLGEGNAFPTVTGINGQSCTLNADLGERNDGYVALFNSSGTLSFSSCLGGEVSDGSSREALRGVNIGINGHLYVTGYSSMSDYPMVNAVQPTKILPGARLVTLSQINPVTGELVFSTWWGPSEPGFPPIGEEYSGNPVMYWPTDIISDSEGNIIVTGQIQSLSFPTVNALQSNMGVPSKSTDFLSPVVFGRQSIDYVTDLFVSKIHPANGVIFSTYLGGGASDSGIAQLALDSEDNIYVSGITAADDFPVFNAIQSSAPSDWSAVLSKITAEGALAFSTYLGGSEPFLGNVAPGVVVNSSDQIIVAGTTASADFPLENAASALSGTSDMTLVIIDQSADTDTDGDGVPDSVDAFPDNDAEWRNLDGDELGDNADPDDDGDDVSDVSDRFPQNGFETLDSDEDGAGDNLDEFDSDPYNYFDFDSDGLADFDPTELDDDQDGVDDATDLFDFDATEFKDSDGDGQGDNSDLDNDNDGLPDLLDPGRLDAEIPVMTFESYDPYDTNRFKSPWPAGFEGVDGTDAAWTSAEDQSFSGNRSFSSRIIDHGQVAAIKRTDTFPAGEVEFRYKVDSQNGADLFTFSIDGVTQLTSSGDTGWQLFKLPITAGAHTFEWRYTKDGTVSEGDDAAWIDDLHVRVEGGPVNMNAGLNDAWFNPETAGQGFFITVFPELGYVSLSWFTYDTVRPDPDVTANLGEPGHRWLNALGVYSGNQAVMDITIASGGIFDTQSEITEVNDGTIILTFTDCVSGTVEYDIPSIGQKGLVPIQRVVSDNIALCESMAEPAVAQQSKPQQSSDNSHTLSIDVPITTTEASPLVDMNAGLNDAWYNPETNGQGFFITVFPEIEYVSLSWFTYDTVRPDDGVTANLGEPGHRWLNALGTYSGNKAVMDITIASGGVFNTQTEITEVSGGTVILTFTNCESGTIEYDIPSINQQGTVPIQRAVDDNIALCEALNAD